MMETERMFLNSEMSLPDLSEKLGVSSHDVSYALNEGLNTISLPVTTLPSGTYIIQLQAGDVLKQSQFVKQ